MANLNDYFDQADIDRAMETDPDVRKAKRELAEDAVKFAQSKAPVDEGDYRNGIKVIEDGDEVGIGFTDPKSHIIEYGSEDTPEFGIMAQTQARFRETDA